MNKIDSLTSKQIDLLYKEVKNWDTYSVKQQYNSRLYKLLSDINKTECMTIDDLIIIIEIVKV